MAKEGKTERARLAAQLFRNREVSGALTDAAGAEAGSLDAVLDVTKLGYENGTLVVSGALTYHEGGEPVRQQLVEVPAALTEGSVGQTEGISTQQFGDDEPGKCDILFLDLAPLHLNLLGLELDLSRIQLDLDATPGPGNLLGNLLCAVLHLLDGGQVGAILALLGQINAILDSILNLLG